MKSVLLFSKVILIAFTLKAQQYNYDCSSAFMVCSNDPIVINQLPGAGKTDEVYNPACFDGYFPETNSVWLKWRVDSDGKFGFTILPMDETDDIDFVLYKMTNGIDDCDQLEEIRCMASGENRGEPDKALEKTCTGATGLENASVDEKETAGCSDTSDNFLSGIDVRKGENYVLFINNYYASNGFLLEFTGTVQLASLPGICHDNDDEEGAGQTALNGIAGEGIIIGPAFPNPANTVLNVPVNSGRSFDGGEIQLINSQGDLVRSQIISVAAGEQQVSTSLSGLPKGVYFLKLMLGENQHITRFSKF